MSGGAPRTEESPMFPTVEFRQERKAARRAARDPRDGSAEMSPTSPAAPAGNLPDTRPRKDEPRSTKSNKSPTGAEQPEFRPRTASHEPERRSGGGSLNLVHSSGLMTGADTSAEDEARAAKEARREARRAARTSTGATAHPEEPPVKQEAPRPASKQQSRSHGVDAEQVARALARDGDHDQVDQEMERRRRKYEKRHPHDESPDYSGEPIGAMGNAVHVASTSDMVRSVESMTQSRTLNQSGSAFTQSGSDVQRQFSEEGIHVKKGDLRTTNTSTTPSSRPEGRQSPPMFSNEEEEMHRRAIEEKMQRRENKRRAREAAVNQASKDNVQAGRPPLAPLAVPSSGRQPPAEVLPPVPERSREGSANSIKTMESRKPSSNSLVEKTSDKGGKLERSHPTGQSNSSSNQEMIPSHVPYQRVVSTADGAGLGQHRGSMQSMHSSQTSEREMASGSPSAGQSTRWGATKRLRAVMGFSNIVRTPSAPEEEFAPEAMPGWQTASDDDEDKRTSTSGGGEVEEEKPRVIYINDREKNKEFCGNRIRTAKYTVITFLPKNLFEQFRRVANAYFLVIACLQLVPGISPVSPWTSILPLVLVLGFTALKEGIEDIRRHKSDKQVNNFPVHILRNGNFLLDRWMNVHVGDIVRIDREAFAPSDILILASSDEQGMCYVETAQLDGETNMKIRQAKSATCHLTTPELLNKFSATIECEQPNDKLYNFTGVLKIGDRPDVPLDIKQIFLRGCRLHNTEHLFGVVVFTGADTKLVRNGTQSKSKRSQVEIAMNRNVMFVFLIMFIICLLSATLGSVFYQNHVHDWYLVITEVVDTRAAAVFGALGFLTFIILYNVLVPISLYVSVEMVKVAQALLIGSDGEMYDPVNDTPAQARTSNLSEELGQVKYIFSDKTGTLTCNMMEFLKCSIAGVAYGHGTTEIGLQALRRRGQNVQLKPRNMPGKERQWNFDDPELQQNLEHHETAPIIREFLTLLAVCHTVLPEKDATSPMGVRFQASSPDEGALVEAAHYLGFKFHSRTNEKIVVNVLGKDENYELLNILEFNSVRKRMSVIVRAPDGRIKLYCKGADDVIYKRLRSQHRKQHSKAKLREVDNEDEEIPTVPDYEETTLRHLESFASEGLRTMVLAFTVLDEEAYEEWSHVFYAASVAVAHRDAKLDYAAEMIERDLVLLGATGIEDKLQEGVPKTIATLLDANIKIWVLTGDKQETAINIGFACSLLNQKMDLIVINATEENEAAKKLDDAVAQYRNNARQNAVVIDGGTLELALGAKTNKWKAGEGPIAGKLLALVKICTSVVCCRMSPKQKAAIVLMVRKNMPGDITLAIGDGANDVSMIAEAHVGVGISGQEGMQAAMASDYTVGQFRFLQRLLLVHGRWSYKRITRLILYSFYKNFAFCLTQLWFQIYCGFSGQTVIDSWYIATYNMIWTGAPILMLAVFDRDVDAAGSLAFPKMYEHGQQHRSFNTPIFFAWLLEGMYQSAMLFFLPMLAFPDMSIWELGSVIYTACIVTVTLKVAMISFSWTWLNHLFIWGSMVAWFVFFLAYTYTFNSFPVFGIFVAVVPRAEFWLTILLLPFICLLPHAIYSFVSRTWWPEMFHLVQEGVRQGVLRGRRAYDGTVDWWLEQTSKTVKTENVMSHVAKSLMLSISPAIQLLRDGEAEPFRGFQFAHERGEADFLYHPKRPVNYVSDEMDEEFEENNGEWMNEPSPAPTPTARKRRRSSTPALYPFPKHGAPGGSPKSSAAPAPSPPPKSRARVLRDDSRDPQPREGKRAPSYPGLAHPVPRGDVKEHSRTAQLRRDSLRSEARMRPSDAIPIVPNARRSGY